MSGPLWGYYPTHMGYTYVGTIDKMDLWFSTDKRLMAYDNYRLVTDETHTLIARNAEELIGMLPKGKREGLADVFRAMMMLSGEQL